jgi:RNA-directed DNA polymerase
MDRRAEPSPARAEGTSSAELWEVIWSKGNLLKALKRVEVNRGAPGVDGMRTQELRAHLQTEWGDIREALEGDRYRPSPARRVEIPKP